METGIMILDMTNMIETSVLIVGKINEEDDDYTKLNQSIFNTLWKGMLKNHCSASQGFC